MSFTTFGRGDFFSPPAAASNGTFLDILRESGAAIIRAKTAAEVERITRRETPIASQALVTPVETAPTAGTSDGQATAPAGPLMTTIRNLSDVQLAGLISAGLLTVALFVRLTR